MRVIEHFHCKGDSERVAFVPLGQNGEKGHAIISEDDLDLLISLGLSLKWNRNRRTGNVFAPAYRAKGGNVQVARVLLDCGPGECASFRNGDPTDLRRNNLKINASGYGTRRDRDCLTPPERRQFWGPQVQHVYACAVD